jgi:hypothetical protein
VRSGYDIRKITIALGGIEYIATEYIIRAETIKNPNQALHVILLRMGKKDKIDVPVPKRHMPPEAGKHPLIGSAVHQHVPSVGKADVSGISLAYVTKYYMQFAVRKRQKKSKDDDKACSDAGNQISKA